MKRCNKHKFDYGSIYICYLFTNCLLIKSKNLYSSKKATLQESTCLVGLNYIGSNFPNYYSQIIMKLYLMIVLLLPHLYIPYPSVIVVIIKIFIIEVIVLIIWPVNHDWININDFIHRLTILAGDEFSDNGIDSHIDDFVT